MKRIGLKIVLLGIALFLFIQWPAIVAVFPFSMPPAVAYGEGKFMRFKRVADSFETQELIGFLETESPELFNRRRKELGLSSRYLHLKGLQLAGKNLRGIDLSRCVLTGCDFSGSDLHGASFAKSYLAQTIFGGPFQLEHDNVTPKRARITDLSDADFEGATFEAALYITIKFGVGRVKVHTTGLTDCNVNGCRGVPDPLLERKEWDVPVELSGNTFHSVAPKGATGFASVSIPCENPFLDLPDSALDDWTKMGVDVRRLRSLQARQLKGDLLKMARAVVNPDSNMVMVLTDRSYPWMSVVSAGPVVAMYRAGSIGNLVSDSVLWLRDEVWFNSICVGQPVIFEPEHRFRFARALFSPTYAWAEPGAAEGGWMNRLLAKKSIDEVARTIGRAQPYYIEPTNKGTDLPVFIDKYALKSLLRDHPEVEQMPLAVASGQYYGARAVDVIQTNPTVVLVLNKGFETHGGVFSAGPIVGTSGGGDPILSQTWVDGSGRRERASTRLRHGAPK